MDPYVTLGVVPNAPQADLERAYKARLTLLHPDRVASLSMKEREAAECMMADLQAAWALIGDDRARARYDTERRAEEKARTAATEEQARASSRRRATQNSQARPRSQDSGWDDYGPWTDIVSPAAAPQPSPNPTQPNWAPFSTPPAKPQSWSRGKIVVAIIVGWILLGPLSEVVGHAATLWVAATLLVATTVLIVHARRRRSS